MCAKRSKSPLFNVIQVESMYIEYMHWPDSTEALQFLMFEVFSRQLRSLESFPTLTYKKMAFIA